MEHDVTSIDTKAGKTLTVKDLKTGEERLIHLTN